MNKYILFLWALYIPVYPQSIQVMLKKIFFSSRSKTVIEEIEMSQIDRKSSNDNMSLINYNPNDEDNTSLDKTPNVNKNSISYSQINVLSSDKDWSAHAPKKSDVRTSLQFLASLCCCKKHSK